MVLGTMFRYFVPVAVLPSRYGVGVTPTSRIRGQFCEVVMFTHRAMVISVALWKTAMGTLT